MKHDLSSKNLEELIHLKAIRQEELLRLTKSHFDRNQARCAVGIHDNLQLIDHHIRKLMELNAILEKNGNTN